MKDYSKYEQRSATFEPLNPYFLAPAQKILFENWDPIGINEGSGSARNEYDGYIDEIWLYLQNGASAPVLADLLRRFIHEHMGLSHFNHEVNLKCAKLLSGAYEKILAADQ